MSSFSNGLITLSPRRDMSTTISLQGRSLKLLLINPTRAGFDSYCTAPLHLLYIAQAAREAGHQAEVMDLHYMLNKRVHFNWGNLGKAEKTKIEDELIEEVLKKDFDVLGIGSIVSSYAVAERLVTRVKQVKDVPIVLGGALGATVHNLWATHTQVDYLVEADGEDVIKELLNHLGDTAYLRTIPGLYVRENGHFVVNRPELSKSLDTIPFPNWDDIEYQAYMKIQREWIAATLPHGLKPTEEDNILPIVATRGCPYHCTFCFHQMNDWTQTLPASYRKHSVDYLIRYISGLREKYGVTMLVTWDDLIMTDRKWFMDLLDAIIAQQWDLKIFTSGGKANIVTRDMCFKMKQAGFIRISYGIETGSPKIIKSMKKGHTVADNRNAINWAREAGLFVHCNMIAGMPGETHETLQETKQFLFDLDLHASNISFAHATAYPGTELFEIGQNMGLIPKDPDGLREYILNVKGVGDYRDNFSEISKEEIREFVRTIRYELQMNWLKNRGMWARCFKVWLGLRLSNFYYRRIWSTKLDHLLKQYVLTPRVRVLIRSVLLQDAEAKKGSEEASLGGSSGSPSGDNPIVGDEAKVSASC
ncbi:MAG: B12-binding domain-containing radical SAM protein [Candidatus Tectomicrobia bacterium]|uniref:B12-binding domain-containing radical SAM protein n=1 Tax=Tectimicrobiota bacterium TaxID=2528274 RepID=A0A937W3S6_UNCTE|nr:B12-binding domain-containing radical SAM protein [Candidatus Tectomicrobia bacterium]